MRRRSAEKITVPPPEIMMRAAAMTARGAEPRRHHTMPRFYLRKWATDDLVRVRSAETGRPSYLAATAKASTVNDFYRLDAEVEAGMSPVVWEAWHSDIEGRAAPVLELLRDRDVDELGWEDRLALCTFLAAFHTRSRGYVERARQNMVEGQRAIITTTSDSALARELRRRSQPADAEAVARARAEMIARLPGFKSAQRTRTEELGMAAEAAATIAVLLFMRRMTVYNAPQPLITCDEPLIELQPDMGQPQHSGGIWGAPFLLFPLGPRQVLVLARSDLPVTLPTQATLTGREALDVNSVVVGNADRLIVAEPEVRLVDQLYIPGIPTFVEERTGSATSNSFRTDVQTGRRWHGERDAPRRPISRLWPYVLPPAPPMSEEMRQSLKRLRANQG